MPTKGKSTRGSAFYRAKDMGFRGLGENNKCQGILGQLLPTLQMNARAALGGSARKVNVKRVTLCLCRGMDPIIPYQHEEEDTQNRD